MPQTSAGAAKRTGEFELIRRLASVLGEGYATGAGRRALIGIGDDCAAIAPGPSAGLLTADAMVDGVHFRSGEIDWADLGWKSMVSNQSDMAAMGGVPEFALVTLGLPEDLSAPHVECLYRGIRAAAAEFGGEVVGGDVVRSQTMFVSVSLYGSAGNGADGEPILMRRDRARVGDRIAVTGPLGGSGGGLRALAEGRTSNDAALLKRAHFAPSARVDAGCRLAAGGVRCAIDVSDGLVADLTRICEASGVSAEIMAEQTPAPPELKREFPEDWLDLALAGGEDYELLVAAPAETIGRISAGGGDRLHLIGTVTGVHEAGQPFVNVIGPGGEPLEVGRMGWDHFDG